MPSACRVGTRQIHRQRIRRRHGCFSLPSATGTLGKAFAECPIKDTRQRGLCRSIFCLVFLTECLRHSAKNLNPVMIAREKNMSKPTTIIHAHRQSDLMKPSAKNDIYRSVCHWSTARNTVAKLEQIKGVHLPYRCLDDLSHKHGEKLIYSMVFYFFWVHPHPR